MKPTQCISSITSVILLLGLISCKEEDSNRGSNESDGSRNRTRPPETQHSQIRSSEVFDLSSSLGLASLIDEEGINDENYTLLVEDLRASLQESGNYNEIIQVIKALPKSLWTPTLFQFRDVHSPLLAEDEIAGRLSLLREITGIDGPSNGYTQMFFEGSSSYLSELRRTGIRQPQESDFLEPVYLDLARANPRTALAELEEDSVFWDTSHLTATTVKALLKIDPLGASSSILELKRGTTKDQAIKSLLRWMGKSNETQGLADWIELISDEALRNQEKSAYLGDSNESS